MDVAVSGFFEVGKQLPGRCKRKALLANSMGLNKTSKKFCTAWDQLKAEGPRAPTRQAGNRLLPSLLGTETVFCTAWKQRV
jgi:hypothetical protein